MVSTRAKGRIYELMCKKKLESKGWVVQIADMPQKFKKNQDIFGIFDLIAVRKKECKMCKGTGFNNEHMYCGECEGKGILAEKIYVQVKYNCSWRKKVLKDLVEFKTNYLDKSDKVQLWDYKKNKGWRIDEVEMQRGEQVLPQTELSEMQGTVCTGKRSDALEAEITRLINVHEELTQKRNEVMKTINERFNKIEVPKFIDYAIKEGWIEQKDANRILKTWYLRDEQKDKQKKTKGKKRV